MTLTKENKGNIKEIRKIKEIQQKEKNKNNTINDHKRNNVQARMPRGLPQRQFLDRTCHHGCHILPFQPIL